jgi:membrane fusion protein (multidrug efflux system)
MRELFFIMLKFRKISKKRLLSARSLSALCLLLFIVSTGCSGNADTPADAAEQGSGIDAAADYTVSVKVGPVERAGIKSTIHAVGTVAAINQAKVSAKIPGKVERIFVEEGDRVKAGQTLLCLEKIDMLLTVRQAQAAVSMAEANYSKAETEWLRAQELMETGITSQQQFDLAKSSFDIATASIEQAEADLGLTRNQLDAAEVTALLGGTVIHRFVDLGERVNPGQPLFEVAEIDPIEIEIGVSDKRFSELKVGQAAPVSVDGYPNMEFDGEVKKIQPTINPMTRTFKVTVGVANPEELLKPGMFARADIQIDYHDNTLVMHRAALLEEEGKYYAVAVRDGRAYRAEISPGYRDGDFIEVLDGLVEGDQVVLEGAYALAQDAPVQIAGE